LYGGTERVVAYLTDELVNLGHEVTLFASGDSRTKARLVPAWERALRLAPHCGDHVAPHILMLEKLAAAAESFDLIHFHIGEIHLPLARRLGIPHLTTLHGRLDLPELGPLYREYVDAPLVSISDAQRLPLKHANWLATVHHGVAADPLPFGTGTGGYLAFLGRISPEKRVDRAIAIARAVGQPLKIAAKVDRADADYFEHQIRPLLDDPLVEFKGEIGEADKGAFLGGAKALLFPIDWPEPFGLVMIESLACGTPVVAFRGGSVPEVIEDGRTGFIADSLEQAIEQTRRIDTLDRTVCRDIFERRFSTRRMAEDYVECYRRAIAMKATNLAA
jgi:glycosyltransferase involved in cell wall biosynthesis